MTQEITAAWLNEMAGTLDDTLPRGDSGDGPDWLHACMIEEVRDRLREAASSGQDYVPRSEVDLYRRATRGVTLVLDRVLGPDPSDRTDRGVAEDVRLLAFRYQLAIAALEENLPTRAAEIQGAQLPDDPAKIRASVADRDDAATRPEGADQ